MIFSGGSAANSLVEVFSSLSSHRSSPLNYIIPISDNGGSSSELIRVFGGPGIGDIRSRLVRLIPTTHTHIHSLLNHRLSSSSEEALKDWQDIVSGTSVLWRPISPAARELLRSMLNHLNMEILKRARAPYSTFNFSSASIGNLFLTGARLFTGSFESAIYLLTLVCNIPTTTSVIPAINSNFSHHISATLANGDTITGQNNISHPSAPTALPDRRASFLVGGESTLNPAAYAVVHEDEAHPEDANLPGTLQTLREPSIHFSKTPDTDDSLPARIERIWYINPYGQEISPFANPKAVNVVKSAEAIIYSIGSLYTSIVPCLILRGIGEAIASVASTSSGVGIANLAGIPSGVNAANGAAGTTAKPKILILNGSLDRETGPRTSLMSASDFIAAIARAGEESQGRLGPANSEIWNRYVTHLIYMEGENVPKVDKKELAAVGVESIRCYGRKGEDGSMRYDGKGLLGVLEAILGRGEGGKGERSRRNTES